MKALTITALTVTALATTVIILSCTPTVEPTPEAVNPTTTRADNEYSDAAASPGGTGGVPVTGVAVEGEETQSFFTAFQLDPEAEDTAGPKFVVSGDINQDGLIDLVTAWNQSQPVQLHLQQRDGDGNIAFRTISIAGTNPVAVVAGVALGNINDDDLARHRGAGESHRLYHDLPARPRAGCFRR